MEKLKSALIVVATSDAPLTSRELADKIGIDYRRNFNKREARYARRLVGFVDRRRPRNDETIKWPERVNRWFLADRWLGRSADDIAAAFDAAELVRQRRRVVVVAAAALPPAPMEVANA